MQGVMSICVQCGHTNGPTAYKCIKCGRPTRVDSVSALPAAGGTPFAPPSHSSAIVQQMKSPAVSTNDFGVDVPSHLSDSISATYDPDDEGETIVSLAGGRSIERLQEVPPKLLQTEDLPSSPMRSLQPPTPSPLLGEDAEELMSQDVIEIVDESDAELLPAGPRGGTVAPSVVEALRADPLLGAKIGRYRILRKIGAGGFGAVYEADQDLLERKVAIKILHVDMHEPIAKERFFREARALGRLRHRNIVQIVDFGEIEGEALYLVMELLEGPSLRDFLRGNKAFSVERVRRIASHLCDALDYIHNEKIYHRDLKPGNILMVEHQGYGEVTKLIDFGVASVAEEENALTRTGACLGSPSYMSPEQAKGNTRDVDGRSDLYSLGILLYQMLTGRLPFKAANFAAMLSKHLFADPPSLAEAMPERQWAPELERLLQFVLAKEPVNRPPSARVFGELCDKALAAQEALDNGTASSATPLDAGFMNPFAPMTPAPLQAVEQLGEQPFDDGDEATAMMDELPEVLQAQIQAAATSAPDFGGANSLQTLAASHTPPTRPMPAPFIAPPVGMAPPVAATPIAAAPAVAAPAEARPPHRVQSIDELPAVGHGLTNQAERRSLAATELEMELPDPNRFAWAEPDAIAADEPKTPITQRSWFLGLSSLLVVLSIGGGVFWLLEKNVSTTPSTVRRGKTAPQRDRAPESKGISARAPVQRPVAKRRDVPVAFPNVRPLPMPKQRVLLLNSTPPGAVVWLGKTRLGTTPARLKLSTDKPTRLFLRKRGFYRKTVRPRLDKEVTRMNVTLRRYKRAPRRRAAPRIRDLYGIGDDPI